MSVDLKPFYRKYNFKYDDNLAYGFYNNRNVTFIPMGPNYKVTISFNVPLTKEQAYQISLKIRPLKEKYRPLLQGLVTNINLELILYQGSDLLENIENILSSISQIIDEQSTSDFGICPLCGKALPTDSPFMRIKDSVIQAHDECLKTLETESLKFNNAKVNNDSKSTRKAIMISSSIAILVVLSSILLGIVQAYPYIISIFGWLSFYISTIFYTKAKIPVLRKTALIIGIFSIISYLLAAYFGSITYLYSILVEKPDNIGFVFTYYFEILQSDPSLFKLLVFEILIGFAFVLLPFVNMLRKTKNHYANSMKRL